MGGKVSVIVPICNCENYLDRCMEALTKQTYRNIEILLMVTFCKDNSLEKCLEWQKKDERIIVVSRKDTSLGDARNYALKIATGEFVAYLDGDDFYQEDYIEKMAEPLIADETIDISCCGYDRFEAGGFLKGEIPSLSGAVNLDYKKYLEYVPAAAVWMKMFRRNWLLSHRIEMFDGCCEDQSLHFVLAALVRRAYFIGRPLYHYNIGNENSLVRTMKSRLDYADASGYAIEYLEKRNLFEENRIYIMKHVCSVFKVFLEETDYDKEMVSVCKDFLQRYFPEAVEQYRAWMKRDVRIKEKIVLYGAGADGEKFLKQNGPDKIAYIVDNNAALQGQYKYGLPIKPARELYQEAEEVSVIVASRRYYFEIVWELLEHHRNNFFTPKEYAERMIGKMFANTGRNIVIFNIPTHANIGDHMIAEAERLFFERYFPDFHIVEITSDFYREFHRQIRLSFCPEDVLVITGGGFLGSLWMDGGEENVRWIMKEYQEHRIIVFPQSIFFEDTDGGKKERQISEEIYNSCDKLMLFCREENSYYRALKIMKKKETCRLVPDIVLSLKKSDFLPDEKIERNDFAGICLKDCIESIYDGKRKNEIASAVKMVCPKICFTSMYAKQPVNPHERRRYIADKLREISSYRVVVTDALHCMISCAITGTPCVALDNISGKVKGVYQWIKSLPYIAFADNVGELGQQLERVMNCADREYVFDYMSYADELVNGIQEGE